MCYFLYVVIATRHNLARMCSISGGNQNKNRSLTAVLSEPRATVFPIETDLEKMEEGNRSDISPFDLTLDRGVARIVNQGVLSTRGMLPISFPSIFSTDYSNKDYGLKF